MRVLMDAITEKFTVKLTEAGFSILSSEGGSLHFTAGEALMLLDILKNEERQLKKMAEEASPLPLRINVD